MVTDWILPVTAVASVIVAIIAAVAAFRSARAAEKSAESAAAIPRRALIRDVAATAERVVDWANATAAKGEEWKGRHDRYCGMSGQGQSGYRIAVHQKIAAMIAEVGTLRGEAEAINRDSPQLHAASDDDLSIRLGKLTAVLDKLQRIYTETTAHMATLETDRRDAVEQQLQLLQQRRT